MLWSSSAADDDDDEDEDDIEEHVEAERRRFLSPDTLAEFASKALLKLLLLSFAAALHTAMLGVAALACRFAISSRKLVRHRAMSRCTLLFTSGNLRPAAISFLGRFVFHKIFAVVGNFSRSLMMPRNTALEPVLSSSVVNLLARAKASFCAFACRALAAVKRAPKR